MTVITEFSHGFSFRQKDIIDTGFHAVVFNINKHWVGRWSTDPKDGFQAIWNIPSFLRERLSLPRFDSVLSNPDERFFVVERLYPIDPILFIGTDKAHFAMNEFWLTDKCRFTLSDYLPASHPLYEITQKIYVAWRYLRMKKIYVSIDITPSNIMMRKDGTFVLSDPFGTIVFDTEKFLATSWK